MNNNPFFSIIIPTYNRENFLEKAINSIVDQTYYNWELIIIDDGSTDKTKELIDKFQIKDSRIIYLYQKNQERSAARNNGIKNSRGKYICFLDSDDEFKPNHLQLFSEVINTLDNAKHMLFAKYISPEIKNKHYNKYEKILKYMIHPALFSVIFNEPPGSGRPGEWGGHVPNWRQEFVFALGPAYSQEYQKSRLANNASRTMCSRVAGVPVGDPQPYQPWVPFWVNNTRNGQLKLVTSAAHMQWIEDIQKYA